MPERGEGQNVRNENRSARVCPALGNLTARWLIPSDRHRAPKREPRGGRRDDVMITGGSRAPHHAELPFQGFPTHKAGVHFLVFCSHQQRSPETGNPGFSPTLKLPACCNLRTRLVTLAQRYRQNKPRCLAARQRIDLADQVPGCLAEAPPCTLPIMPPGFRQPGPPQKCISPKETPRLARRSARI